MRTKSGRFAEGVSGNPTGRPTGSGLSGQLRRAIGDEINDILLIVIEQAKAGDLTASKLLLDRVLPSLKPEAQTIQLSELSGGGDLLDKAGAIIHAAGNGDIAPDVAAQLIGAVSTLGRIKEINELEQRLDLLEKTFKQKGKHHD